MTPLNHRQQLNLASAVAIWASVLVLGAFLGAWLGLGGRRFAIALLVAGVLLAGHLFLAARGGKKIALDFLGPRGVLLAPLVPLGAYVIYAAGANALDWKGMLWCAAYVLAPPVLALAARGKNPGSWADYLAVLAIWLPVELRWLYKLWPYPPPLTHTLTILLALTTGLATFLFVRWLDGIGYTIEWGRGFGRAVGVNLALIAIIVIPLGMKLGFLAFAPSLTRLRSLPLAALGILFFTAWPEEFLFRGLLQNLLTRTLGGPWAGLLVASVIFGCAHLNNGPFPNWRYAILATIAGFFYGRAWMRTGSLFPSALIHATVDTLWHILFR